LEARQWRVGEVIAAFYFIIVGIINPISSVSLLLVSGMGDTPPDNIFYLILVGLLILALLSFIASVGIFLRKRWGRILGAIISAVEFLLVFQMFSFSEGIIGVIIDFFAIVSASVLIFLIISVSQEGKLSLANHK
jgi:uncharacterized membrane protein (DUF2068 family)